MSANELPLGVLKATPEDFVVQELVGNPPSAVPFSETTRIQGWDGQSAVTVFQMSKRGWETEAAVREVARQLAVPFDAVSFHGIKDKRACTSQLVGVRGKFQPAFSHPDISLVQLTGQESGSVELDTYGKLRQGGNRGNRFNILIRSAITELDLPSSPPPMPNLFGQQRMGRPGTEQIGRLFLEGKPDEAIQLLLDTPSKAVFLRAKKLAGGTDEGALSYSAFQFFFKFEIQKWQSYLWNTLLQEKVKELGEEGVPAKLPLWNSTEQVRKMYQHLWDPPQLNPRVLRMVAIFERPSILKPTNFQAKREAEGWRFTFDLPSGAYATVVLSQLFKLEERRSRLVKREEVPAVKAESQQQVEPQPSESISIWSPEAVRKRALLRERIRRMLDI